MDHRVKTSPERHIQLWKKTWNVQGTQMYVHLTSISHPCIQCKRNLLWTSFWTSIKRPWHGHIPANKNRCFAQVCVLGSLLMCLIMYMHKLYINTGWIFVFRSINSLYLVLMNYYPVMIKKTREIHRILVHDFLKSTGICLVLQQFSSHVEWSYTLQ